MNLLIPRFYSILTVTLFPTTVARQRRSGIGSYFYHGCVFEVWGYFLST